MDFKKAGLILGFLPLLSLPVTGFSNELVLNVNSSLEDEEKFSLRTIQYFYDYSSITQHNPLEKIQNPIVLPWQYDGKNIMMMQVDLWDEGKKQIDSSCFYWDEHYIYSYISNLNVEIFRINDGGYSWNACELN